jgi:hypothetical protein
MTIPRLRRLAVLLLLSFCVGAQAQSTATGSQQLALAGLRSSALAGSFRAVQSDASGNLYLAYDQQDGVRVLKLDSTGTQLLAQAHLGATGDTALTLALDPSGNVYVGGTSSSGTLSGTSGAAYTSPTDSTVTAFFARFDTNLTEQNLTFCGSGRTALTGMAVTSDAVFLTGSIFGSTLPVTGSGVQQAPGSGSSGNGFVERFNSTGTTLVYATYLTGANGTTAPSTIASGTDDQAFIGGYTTSTGYPTVAAIIPEIPSTASSSGFLSKLAADGSSFVFSTFIPGAGVSTVRVDTTNSTLLLSGTIDPGAFPVTSAPTPLVAATYQTLVRLPLNGSSVTSSTVLAPAAQSVLTVDPSGNVWVAGQLSLPLLPLAPLATIGDTFAVRLNADGVPDQAARFGGIVGSNATRSTVSLAPSGLTTTATGGLLLAGELDTATSGTLVSSQTFDLPLTGNASQGTALPSSANSTLPAANACSGSTCGGSAGYLARLVPGTAAPGLSFSADAAPNVILRNLGSTTATGLQVTATGFTVQTTCGSTLAAGASCALALTGTGPGTITASATNATTQTASIPALAAGTTPQPITFLPRELDFGVSTAAGGAVTRTVTVTNLTQQSQTFSSALDTTSRTATPFTYAESSSTCTIAGVGTKMLASGASCTITFSLTASSTASNDGPAQALWTIGGRDLTLRGFAQAKALNVSTSTIDFGTRIFGGIVTTRSFYLSNNGSQTVSHTPLQVPSGSPFSITDNCGGSIAPQTVCQVQVGYTRTTAPATDSVLLTLDDGQTVLLRGSTLPPATAGAASTNPSLNVTPTSVTFANTILETTVSSETQTVTIQNTGGIPLPLTLALTGDFTQQTSCGSTLAAGASCAVNLNFAPAQQGLRQGVLTITTTSSFTPSYVQLSGTATPLFAEGNGVLSFGPVPVGEPIIKWYKINAALQKLTATVSGSGSFGVLTVEDIGYGHGSPGASSFQPTATGTCLNCYLGVLFKPTSIGAQTGSLSLATTTGGNPLILSLNGSGTALTGLVLTPVSQDYASVPVNSSTTSATFTATNLTTNAAAVNITSVTASGDFHVSNQTTGGAACTGSLAPMASCLVTVLFSPTTTGARTGTLTLTGDIASATAALTGTGTADPGLSLNPTSLVFQNVPGSSATQQTIVLMNTGTATLTIGAPTVATTNFTVSSGCTTLAAGATCTLTVTYIPAANTVTDTLSFTTTSQPASGQAMTTTYQVPLSGAYTSEEASLQFVPGQLQFGPLADGTLGLSRQVTLNNLTAQSLSVSVAIPRQFALIGAPCSGLGPNASCTFSVAFLPLTNGDITGSLFAQANNASATGTNNAIGYLEGYGTGTGTLAITGNLQAGQVLAYGQVPSGQSSAQTITLTNSGAAGSPSVTIRRLTTAPPFFATSTCGATLAGTQSCTATVTYAPSYAAPTGSGTNGTTRTDTGTLVIESDAGSSPDIVDLNGTVTGSTTAVAPVPISAYAISQSSLTFAATMVGNQSAIQTVTLANTGTATIHFTTPITSTDFTVVSTCATLLPSASCTLQISFTPQTTGTRIGAIAIPSDASTALDFISVLGTSSAPSLVLTPTSLNFGSVVVASTATLPVQVTNQGSSAAIFSSITTTGDYTQSGTCPAAGASLAPNASCTIQVTFAPTTSGQRNGVLAISTSATTLPLNVPLTGSATAAILQVSPSSLDFGTLLLGNSAQLTLTLSNTGTAPLRAVTLNASGDYAVASGCAVATLAAGTSCSVTVVFTPTALGTRTGTLTVASTDLTAPVPVPLTGIAIQSGSFTMSVNGGATAAQTVALGIPASYTLTVTPVGNFTGTVVLNCTPINPAQYGSCALLPSSLQLTTGTAQTATVTINTLTKVSSQDLFASGGAPRSGGTHGAGSAQPGDASHGVGPFGRVLAALMLPSLLLLSRKRRITVRLLGCFLLSTAALLGTNGCGGGNNSGDTTIKYAAPGTYTYQITGSSVSGVQVTQSVTVTVTIHNN